MNKTLLAAALSLTSALSVDAQAAQDWFPGQTGQYHLIPDGQDVQNLTLFGTVDATCSNGLALYAVDEFGHPDSTPFVVPSRTVFVLTDVSFNGFANPSVSGYTPMLTISPSGAGTNDMVAFPASFPLKGNLGEPFAGAGSLQTGATFAVNSKLCAHVIILPKPGPQYDGILGSVIVHGKVVDNYRTTSWPYFTW